MKNYDLVLLNDIISIFEENNFVEASLLHKQFIRLAQPIQNEDEKEALDIISEKSLQDQYKQFAIDYYKSQPQFDESDDFESIFETYGANNNILAEQFLLSMGNESFIDVQDRNEIGEEIVEILETISESDTRLQKLNATLKAAIKRGLPIAFILAGSAKLYYLLKYLIDNREEIAKYATVVFGIISSLLASIPPINFTLFNIQKIPTAYEMVEERRIINVTRTNNIYKYFVEYKTPDDNKNHEVTIITVDDKNDRELTKLKTGPNQTISEPFETSKKYKSIRVYDNGNLVDSQSESETQRKINDTEKKVKTEKPKFVKVDKTTPVSLSNERPLSTPKTKTDSILAPTSPSSDKSPKVKTKIGPNEEKLEESDVFPISIPTTVKPTSNIRNLDIPEIKVETEPITVSPSTTKIKPEIPESKKENKYYLENKPENAKNHPEELGSRRSKIPGVHVFLDDLVENTLKRYLGENVSMKIHEFKTNEYDDVEQFVEFLFPNKKDNFIMEYKLNGNTGRRSMERHPADYFKKKSRFSLPKINLDDEQVQGILSGLLRKK